MPKNTLSVERSPLKRVAIVAGEASGDILGAGLIKSLKVLYPNAQFEGVGGDKMIAEGFVSHYPMDRLSVMGFVEPLKRLPELLAMRKSLRKKYIANPPDLFIGIDSPDFNLSLERAIHQAGVKTAHYVSPSVWAWRQGRVKKIAKSIDLMLTLFPFEAEFYGEHNVKVHCVGHPLADEIPLESDQSDARAQLGIDGDKKYLALMPGSRGGEVEKLTPVFLESAKQCQQKINNLHILIPAANDKRFEQINAFLIESKIENVHLFHGKSHQVICAADALLIASGTSTLEAMLIKRPMVIAYRIASFSYWILKRLVKSKYIGLPNLLANRELAPEFIQDDATPEKLSLALLKFFESAHSVAEQMAAFSDIHLSLKKNASDEAAKELKKLWEQT